MSLLSAPNDALQVFKLHIIASSIKKRRSVSGERDEQPTFSFVNEAAR